VAGAWPAPATRRPAGDPPRTSGRTALEKRLWDSADQFRANSGQVKCQIAKCGFGIAGSSSFEIRHSSVANAPSCIIRLLTEVNLAMPDHGTERFN